MGPNRETFRDTGVWVFYDRLDSALESGHISEKNPYYTLSGIRCPKERVFGSRKYRPRVKFSST